MGEKERLEKARELVRRARGRAFGEQSQVELVELVASLCETIAFQGVEIRGLIDDVEELKGRFGPLGKEVDDAPAT